MTGHSDPCSFRRLSIAVIFFISTFTCARKKAARCVHLNDICCEPSCSFSHRPYPIFPSTFNPLLSLFLCHLPGLLPGSPSVCEHPLLTLRLEVGASCFIDPGYYHTTWQFSHDLHKRYGSASSSPTVIICDLCRQ